MSDTKVYIGISESGRNSTTLEATGSNDLAVRWQLTDGQLLHLAAQAVDILRRRAKHKVCEVDGLESGLRKILDGEDAS
jgi:hypothetical protein